MKRIVPDFYKKFRCVAGACSDTCCAGWEVDVDEKTLSRYKKVPGPFGKKLGECVSDGHFVLAEKERCPFLDENNLCEIHRNLGEDALSDICREHPRFVEVFGDVEEKGLGLCCEESARLLLSSDRPLRFEETESSEKPEPLDGESRALRDEMFEFRSDVLSRLSDRTVPLPVRLAEVLCLAATAQGENVSIPETSSQKFWNEVLRELFACESLGEKWDAAQGRILEKHSKGESSTKIFSDADGERIVSYQIFRYLAKALYDGDMLSRVKFAVLFWLLLERFGAELSTEKIPERQRIFAVTILSKELEYSDVNMESLAGAFHEKPFLSTGAFLNLLREGQK